MDDFFFAIGAHALTYMCTSVSLPPSAGPQQEAASKGGSKVTPARVAIVILSVLLAAAVAGLVYTCESEL